MRLGTKFIHSDLYSHFPQTLVGEWRKGKAVVADQESMVTSTAKFRLRIALLLVFRQWRLNPTHTCRNLFYYFLAVGQVACGGHLKLQITARNKPLDCASLAMRRHTIDQPYLRPRSAQR